jgi:hypothetical protein
MSESEKTYFRYVAFRRSLFRYFDLLRFPPNPIKLHSEGRYCSIELQNAEFIKFYSEVQPQKINVQESEIIVDT